jgi:excisionase family DNA binding protein
MDTRRSDGRGLWLRVSVWLRVSAWLPPGLALAWLATLATLIHNIGVMLAAWGATVSLVLLGVLLARHHAPRRYGSPGATTAKPVLTRPASEGLDATGTVPTDTGSAATGQPATQGMPHAPAGIDGKGEEPRGATTPPGPVGAATTRPSTGTDQTLTGNSDPPAATGLLAPELRVLTAEEVASVLHVDLDLVIRSITNGKLPGNHIGSHWLIDQGALMQWLQGSYEAPLRKNPSR